MTCHAATANHNPATSGYLNLPLPVHRVGVRVHQECLLAGHDGSAPGTVGFQRWHYREPWLRKFSNRGRGGGLAPRTPVRRFYSGKGSRILRHQTVISTRSIPNGDCAIPPFRNTCIRHERPVFQVSRSPADLTWRVCRSAAFGDDQGSLWDGEVVLGRHGVHVHTRWYSWGTCSGEWDRRSA